MITITLPWPDKRLSPNARVHWRERAEATKEAREGAYWATTRETLNMRKVLAQYTFHPPDRRKRDIDNFLSMMKPYQDGVSDALTMDDTRIKKITIEWGKVVKGGKVVLTLEELDMDKDYGGHA